MKLSAEAFKGFQSFLILGYPVIGALFFAGFIPVAYTMILLLLLFAVISFIKLELIAYILVTGIESIHKHLHHIEKHGVGRGSEAASDEVPKEIIEGLMELKDRLQKHKEEMRNESE